MGRVLRAALVASGLLALVWAWSGVAAAQAGESIPSYVVGIRILPDGDLQITERIDYDFGSEPRHGIFRTIPSRFTYDDVSDRIYRIEDVEVTSPTAPDDVEVAEDGGVTTIRVGDPDQTITGRHRYTLRYRVEGALNGFPDHDELYWNAIGDEWQAPIERARVTVQAAADIQRVTCFQGYQGSTEECGRAAFEGSVARFAPGRTLQPFEGLTVVVAIPKGAVPEPEPILEERWSASRAFSASPARAIATVVVLALAVGWIVGRWWRSGRDRRYRGSPVDQVMGTRSGEDEPIAWGEGDEEAPVEFSPPDRIHPGQMGLLLDERARTLHVTATIVDLAVRGFLTIEEIEKQGLFGKPDWILRRTDASDDDLPSYEKKLLQALFRSGPEVTVSELRDTFATRLQDVKRSLLSSAVERKWFSESPDRVRTRWHVRGVLLILAGVAITVALAVWTSWALVGLAIVLSGILLTVVAGAMPARTAAGTAIVRRIRGFRRVIATAETHMSRWAEQENVFTRFLPYAIVFGLTEKWAKAFEDLGIQPETASWYVGPHPFTAMAFADSVDAFSVTTGGTLASTPSSSGSSGFGGGGFSGGGGGGGGGGSW